MRIALLAPAEESVPPKQYGGTERVVNTLAEELTGMGHDVTLYASGDSHTSATLVTTTPRAIRRLPQASDPIARQALNLQALSTALRHLQNSNYDIIHNHFGWQPLLFRSFITAPLVTTLHNSLDKYWMPTEHMVYNSLRDCPVISISDSQRRHSPKLNYVATIHHGIWQEQFPFNAKPKGDYLAFLGRIHPHKAPDQAIAIARKTGQKLIIAAKIDPQEEQYWQNEIKPQIDGKQIVYLGEVGHQKKVELLRNAKALLAPVNWDEPFGIVTVESLACGTPVITIRRGSMPEIIEDGKTGFLCKDFDEMTKRVADIAKLDRYACRQSVDTRFTARRMAEDHLKLYEKLIKNHTMSRGTKKQKHASGTMAHQTKT